MSEYPHWQPARRPGQPDGGGYSEPHTPSHGGTVTTGYEYDLVPTAAAVASGDDGRRRTTFTTFTTTTTTTAATTTTPQLSTTTWLPPPSSPSPSRSSTPRPLSMPPQAYVQQPTSTSTSAAAPPQQDPSRESRQPPDNYQNGSRSHREHRSGRSSTRIIGNYTMTKTLGAGSMGKVKLATHNHTGEKVTIIPTLLLPISSNPPLQLPSCSIS